MNSFRIFTLISFLVLSSCATKQKFSHPAPKNTDQLYQYLYAYIDDQIKSNDIAALSIALVHDQSIIWQQGFGFIDLKNKTPARADSQYRAGSISKLFTAVRAMQLHESGVLTLDEDLQSVFPRFRIASRFSPVKITARQVLTHHSGMVTDRVAGFWTETPTRLSSLLNDIEAEYLANPPGEILVYSNLAYSFLGAAIEKKTGMPFEKSLHASVLAPLSMDRSDFTGRFDDTLSNTAKGYIKKKYHRELPVRDIPAAGLNTNVIDLSNFLMMFNANGSFNGQQLLRPESVQQMLTYQQSQHLDFTKRTGIGWFDQRNYLGIRPVFGHNGRTIAHSSLILLEPKSKLGVVILSSSPTDNGAIYSIGRTILRQSFKVLQNRDLPPYYPWAKPAELGAKQFNLAGTYATPLGVAHVTPKPKRGYRVKTLGRTFNLDQEDGQGYQLGYKLFGLFPINLGWRGDVKMLAEWYRGKKYLVGYRYSEKLLVGQQVPVRPLGETWESRVGRYFVEENLEPTLYKIRYLDIKLEHGTLVARLHMKNSPSSSYVLDIIDEQHALIGGRGRSLGGTVSFGESDGRTYFVFSGLKFEKAR